MLAFLNSTVFRAASSALTAIAGVILVACPSHTIAFKVATAVVAFGAAHGVQSSGTSK